MIEDDAELAGLLKERLAQYEIDVDIALTPLEGLEKLRASVPFDALVLDLSLPQMDGLEICRVIRSEALIPIIISSARGDLEDKMVGFERGADDYVPKPYDPIELAARIRAVVRRTQAIAAKPQIFVVDTGSREVLKLGRPCALTPAEYEITAYMIGKAESVVSREELLMNIGAIRYESGLKSIDVIIGRIRQKIGDDPKNPRFILAVRGIGYRFVNA